MHEWSRRLTLPADTLVRARALHVSRSALYPRSLPASPARQKERAAPHRQGACTATISIFLTPLPSPPCCALLRPNAQERKPEVPRLRRARSLAAPRRRPVRRPVGRRRRPARRPVAPRLRLGRRQQAGRRRHPARRPEGPRRRPARKQQEAPLLRPARRLAAPRQRPKSPAGRLRRLERKPRADLLLPQVSLLVGKAG